MSANRVMIFAKAPEPGKVKTRLIPHLNASQAGRLQELFIQRALAWCAGNPRWHTDLWCAPDSEHAFFQELALCYPISLKNQTGADLGARMASAFQTSLTGDAHAVIIGTDCPALTAEHIGKMFSALETGLDAVIIPAEDGGYVALALRRFAAELFHGVRWGGSDVYLATVESLEQLQWRWQALDPLWDVDRPMDLQRLVSSGILPDWRDYLDNAVDRAAFNVKLTTQRTQ